MTNNENVQEIQLPNPFQPFDIKVDNNDESGHYARFIIEPLERGFGLTIGNALRRVLLSALPGASVFAVEIEGVRHEFSSIVGVEEDVTAIILNLKDLVLKIDDSDPSEVKRIEVDFQGPGTLTAGDLVLPALVKVINQSDGVGVMTIFSKIAVDAGTPPLRIGLVQIILVARCETNQTC